MASTSMAVLVGPPAVVVPHRLANARALQGTTVVLEAALLAVQVREKSIVLHRVIRRP